MSQPFAARVCAAGDPLGTDKSIRRTMVCNGGDDDAGSRWRNGARSVDEQTRGRCRQDRSVPRQLFGGGTDRGPRLRATLFLQPICPPGVSSTVSGDGPPTNRGSTVTAGARRGRCGRHRHQRLPIIDLEPDLDR